MHLVKPDPQLAERARRGEFTTVPEDRAKLLPFYLVIDVSFSMDGDNLDAANDIMPELTDAISRNPILRDKVRFCLIDFSDDARLQLPLCDLLDPDVELPGLAVRGATSYAAAFRMLRGQIEEDVVRLKEDRFLVHRPVVFFVSDGTPSDAEQEWRSAFLDLTEYDQQTKMGFALYPNVIPFGVGQAKPKILRSLIHPSSGPRPMRMFLMDKGCRPAEAIRSMAGIMVSSVLNSGLGMANGTSGVVLPDDDQLPTGVSSYTVADENFL